MTTRSHRGPRDSGVTRSLAALHPDRRQLPVQENRERRARAESVFRPLYGEALFIRQIFV